MTQTTIDPRAVAAENLDLAVERRAERLMADGDWRMDRLFDLPEDLITLVLVSALEVREVAEGLFRLALKDAETQIVSKENPYEV